MSWTLVQHAHNFTCDGSATCTITLTQAITPGNAVELLWPGINFSNSASTWVSATGETWVHPSGCAAVNNWTTNRTAFTDGVYVLSAAGGESSITLTLNAGAAALDGEVLEVHRSTGTATFDGCGENPVSGLSFTGPTPTPNSGTNDYCGQWLAYNTGPPTYSGSYSVPDDPDNSNVYGYFIGATNQSSCSGQAFTSPGSGQGAMSGMALK